MKRLTANWWRAARWPLCFVRRLRYEDDGASAVEFGLIAPFLLFIPLLSMVDVGFALTERMTLDTILRAGAQEAMDDPGAERVLDVLEATAATNYPLPPGAEANGVNAPTFSVDYPVCDCPEQKDVACSTTCDGSRATSIFYSLTGELIYQGIFLPDISLAPTVRVQIR